MPSRSPVRPRVMISGLPVGTDPLDRGFSAGEEMDACPGCGEPLDEDGLLEHEENGCPE